MKYVLIKRTTDLGHAFDVLDANSGIRIGYAGCFYPGHYQVDGMGVDGYERVAFVKSIDDIIPALVSFYEDNPPKWEREGPARYSKFTEFGTLVVERRWDEWWASRDGFPLTWSGDREGFVSKEEAQRAADAHKADGFRTGDFPSDGYAWEPNLNSWWMYDAGSRQCCDPTEGTSAQGETPTPRMPEINRPRVVEWVDTGTVPEAAVRATAGPTVKRRHGAGALPSKNGLTPGGPVSHR